MQVDIGSTVTVRDPTPELIQWCKKNLVVTNPDYSKKARMHLWTGNTPRTLNLYETRGNDLVMPFGVLRSIMPLLDGAAVRTAFGDARQIDYHCEVDLYDYQRVAVDASVKAHYGILQSPAGSGKTQMGIALAVELQGRTLWLTHTKDLLNQSKSRAEQYMSSALIGTITEGKVSIGDGITFATIQTMCRLDLAQYKNVWDVVIVDECHRCAGTPTAVSQFYKVLNSLSARHKYGLSATVHRSDGMIAATYALLGEVVHSVPATAIAGRIMRVGIRPIETGITISRDCTNTDGTLNYTSLISYLCETPDRNKLIVSYLTEQREHSTLILSDRLGHLEALINLLPVSMKKQAVMISGKMSSKKGKAEREKAIEDMRTGRKKYLFATYSLAKEGLDIPCLERLFLTTPQKDYAVVTQSIGRIARTHEGKNSPIVYDFIDDIRYLVKSYKARCRTYKKNGCYFVGGETCG